MLLAISVFGKISTCLEIMPNNEELGSQPTMKTPGPDSLDISVLKVSASNDPEGKSVEQFIKSFNSMQRSFDRIVNLAKPFLADNEIGSLKKKAKNNMARQALEIRWLLKVAGHKRKLLKQYEVLNQMRNKLKSGLEVTEENIEDVQKREDLLVDSEENLKMKSHELMRYVVLA